MGRGWWNSRHTHGKKFDIHFVDCANKDCPRHGQVNLEIEKYQATPSELVSPEDIHYVHSLQLAGLSVSCPSCGHYMIFE